MYHRCGFVPPSFSAFVRLAILPIMMACVVALCSGRAWADTAPYSYTHVYVDLPPAGENGQQTVIDWTTFVASIRNAAGHPLAAGGYTTQSTGGDNDNAGGLIVATLTLSGQTLTLFISPRDLYLRGFANNNGDLFMFADTNTNSANTYDLYNAILQAGAEGFASGVGGMSRMYTLPFSSNYNSMTGANNGQGRESLTMSYGNFTDAFYNLAYLTQDQSFSDRAHVARSVMLMIQLTSEAARFNDVLGTARMIMRGPTWDANGYQTSTGTQQGLPLFQQYLENDWATLSNYGWNQLSGNYYSQTFGGINPNTGNWTTTGQGNPQTLNTYNDLLNPLYMLLPGNQVANPDLGGVNGDWNYCQE